VLEVLCAAALALLSAMVVYSVALFEWFQVTYRQYYRQPDRATRTEWLAYEGCEVLLAVWMLVLAANVARTSARRDRGLFGPLALRAWGVIFAALPIVAAIALRSISLDLHMVGFFCAAAVACFTLASRRSKRAAGEAATPHVTAPTPMPIE
jgi:hypothetical protein